MYYSSARSNVPVNTMSTATVILTESSMFPMTALTMALPHSNSMSGFSYIVFANFMSTGSGVDTVNSLYPCLASSSCTRREDRPSVADVTKCARVSFALSDKTVLSHRLTHLY